MARPGDEPVARDASLEADRTSVAGDLMGDSWRRPWYAHVISYVVSVLLIVPAIWLCDWVLDGFHANVQDEHPPKFWRWKTDDGAAR